MRLFEWRDCSFAEHREKLPGFIKYLSEVWRNREKYNLNDNEDTEEDNQEERIQKQRFFDFTYDGRISARNFVGVVQYEGIRVEVYPKIFSTAKEDDASKWQLNLLYWLMYCRKFKFPFTFANVSKMQFDDYLELLIYIFANYAAETLSRQPFQAYQTVEEETVFLRGRLSFDNYIKQNLSTGKWQNFQCVYEPFIYDNQFNRIVKYVTRRLLPISNNHPNKEKLNEILFLLDDVTDIKCSASDCDKVKLNPLYEEHKQILNLCRLYLSNQVIDLENDDSQNFCFLVPMEYVFEDFIYGFVADKWPSLKVISQSSDYLAFNKGKSVFKIKNDMYIKNRLIIDTKYKNRHYDDSLKSGVAQGDMYQMVSYAVKRNCKDVLLLYPDFNLRRTAATEFQITSMMLQEDLNILASNIDITFDDIHLADQIIVDRLMKVHPIFDSPINK